LTKLLRAVSFSDHQNIAVNPTMPKRVIAARSDNVKEVRDYYKNEPLAEHIRERPEDILKIASEKGHVWGLKSEDSVHGVGCRFDYETVDFAELGGDLVSKSISGYRFQTFLVTLRLIEIVMFDPDVIPFAVVSQDNPYYEASKKSLLSNGFIDYDPPERLVEDRNAALNTKVDLEKSDFFVYEQTKINHNALRLSFNSFAVESTHEGGVVDRSLTHSKTGEETVLVLDDHLFNGEYLRQAINEM